MIKFPLDIEFSIYKFTYNCDLIIKILHLNLFALRLYIISIAWVKYTFLFD